MRKATFLLMILGLSIQSYAQEKSIPITVGLTLPYGIQLGAEVGTSFKLKNWESEKRTHQLSVDPQLAFFTFPGVQNNFLVNAELGYKLLRKDKKWYPRATLGLAYNLSAQRVDGSVDLGTGEISRNTRSLNYVVPTVSLGMGRLPGKAPIIT